MDNNLPIDFEEKVRLPPPANGLGYPYRISANDLMQDFVYASPIIEDKTPTGKKNGILVTEATGQGGKKARKISCTYVPEAFTKGALLAWDGEQWKALAPPNKKGAIIFWNGSFWSSLPPAAGEGTSVLSCTGGNLSWIETESC